MLNSWWLPVTFEQFFAIIPSIMAQFWQNLHFFNITFVAPDFHFNEFYLKNPNFKDFFSKNSQFLANSLSPSLSGEWCRLWVMQWLVSDKGCLRMCNGCMLTKKKTQPAQGDTPAPLPVPDCSALGPGSKPMPSTRCAHRGVTDMKVLTVEIARPPPSKGREESCNCNLPPMPATEWWATYTVTAGIWTGAQSICYLAGHPSYRRSDHWATSTAENFNVGNWIWILLR